MNKPCLEEDCPRMAAPGKSRCAPCHRAWRRPRERARNALPSRQAYRDPGYRGYPVAGRLCALQLPGICTTWATTRDHIVPLEQGGSNDHSNLQPACRECNSAKRDRLDAGSSES
jgi:5-methylcytosine-specific restriction endonuclease McrA